MSVRRLDRPSNDAARCILVWHIEADRPRLSLQFGMIAGAETPLGLDAGRLPRQASRVNYRRMTGISCARRRQGALLVGAATMLAMLNAGCAAERFDAAGLGISASSRGLTATAPANFAPEDAELSATPPDPRQLPMFLGATGRVVAWRDVVRAADWADVIMMGEEHDDAVGHAVQLAMMEDVASRLPGAALSMEMLERDEQRLVDDYLEGIIDAGDLAKLTHSEKWAGEDSWKNWYQPVIDAAKAGGGRVIAANAPRRYVQLARRAGFDRVRALPRDRRQFVELPRGSLDTPYRRRFVNLMREMSADDDDEEAASAHQVDAAMAESLFRSQITWDATMADSIHEALKDGATKVVHLVGRFHIEREGGTVEQLRRRRPGARILTIVMSKDDALALREEDRGLADIVIYTGKRVEPEEAQEGVEETGDDDESGTVEPAVPHESPSED
jgi:uncharacterized iron-regulated protein